jgi:hypothetical protein
VNPVELITTGGWMFSIGDVASQQATALELAKRGVPVIPCDESSGERTAVIGGGHVLGHMSHLKQHVIPGRHILNAVGAHRTGDYSYLTEYRYRSVRDSVSLDIIGGNAHLVPCPAMLIEPSRFAIEERGRQRGGHIVVHRDPHCESAMSKRSVDILVVDPQPNRRLPWTSGGREMPVTHSPQMMIAELMGAVCCVTRSLHLAIFALSVGTPFCCLDLGDEPQSNKLREYFRRAGIVDVMYSGQDPVHHAVSRKHDWKSVATREKIAVREHFDRIARSLSE